MVNSPLVVKNSSNLQVFSNSELLLLEAYHLANYSKQNIFKSPDSIIEKKTHGLNKNLVCEQSMTKGSGDNNKTNAFIHCNIYNVD